MKLNVKGYFCRSLFNDRVEKNNGMINGENYRYEGSEREKES